MLLSQHSNMIRSHSKTIFNNSLLKKSPNQAGLLKKKIIKFFKDRFSLIKCLALATICQTNIIKTKFKTTEIDFLCYELILLIKKYFLVQYYTIITNLRWICTYAKL